MRTAALLVLVLGCSPTGVQYAASDTTTSREATVPQPDSLTPEPDTLTLAYMNPNAARLGALGRSFAESRDAPTRHLGQPISIIVETRPGVHGPWTDSLFMYEFRDARVSLLQSGYDGKLLPNAVTLWSEAQPLPAGVRIGRFTRADVERVFGKDMAVRTTADTVAFSFGVLFASEDEVELRFVRDTLRVVHWTFYID